MFNFPEDKKALLAGVQRFEADWGLWIFLLGLVGLTLTLTIPILRGYLQKAVETYGPSSGLLSPKVATKAPQLDRQPINQAYEHLIEVGVFEENGNEALQIANLLRQAALDGEISVWGAEPSSVPVEWQAPFLKEIDRDHWRHHEIDAARLMISVNDLPEKGCTTLTTGIMEVEGYWHLHVSMNQVRYKWADTCED